jgi:hypothetical protein
MPDIAVTAKKSATAITHAHSENEFFRGNLIPEHTRWMVFKVKRRAETNYYKITPDGQDDSNYSFNFETTPQRSPDYTYNWPYDYFSLIELVKMDVKVGIGDEAIPLLPTFSFPLDLKGPLADAALKSGQIAMQAASLGFNAQKAQALATNALGTSDPTKMMGTVGGMLGNLDKGGSAKIPPGLMAGKVTNLLSNWAGGTAGGPIVGGDYIEKGSKNAKGAMNSPAAAAAAAASKSGPGSGKGLP